MCVWRIYYADGSTFDSTQGSPADAPGRGVLCIVQPDEEVGRHVVDRFDFYWWANGEWWGGERSGLDEYLSDHGNKVVKFGRTVSNAEFKAVKKRAVEDSDFPVKSAKTGRER